MPAGHDWHGHGVFNRRVWRVLHKGLLLRGWSGAARTLPTGHVRRRLVARKCIRLLAVRPRFFRQHDGAYCEHVHGSLPRRILLPA